MQAIICLFSRIVDLDRFSEVILPTVREEEKRELHHRLGILNILNPVQVRAYERSTRKHNFEHYCPGYSVIGSGHFHSVQKLCLTQLSLVVGPASSRSVLHLEACKHLNDAAEMSRLKK